MKTFLAGLAAIGMFVAAMVGISMAKTWSLMNKPPEKVESRDEKSARIEKMLERARAEKAGNR